MMMHPSYYDLMNVVNSEVEPGEEPVVSSRYSIIMATSKRARQLVDGSPSLVDKSFPKPLSNAINELEVTAIKIKGDD